MVSLGNDKSNMFQRLVSHVNQQLLVIEKDTMNQSERCLCCQYRTNVLADSSR